MTKLLRRSALALALALVGLGTGALTSGPAKPASLGRAVDFRQTNFEGELIESVHQARRAAAGIVINPAGYTFYELALEAMSRLVQA